MGNTKVIVIKRAHDLCAPSWQYPELQLQPGTLSCNTLPELNATVAPKVRTLLDHKRTLNTGQPPAHLSQPDLLLPKPMHRAVNNDR